MTDKPVLLATRRLPEPVEARARANFSAHFNMDGRGWSRDEILARAEATKADALLVSVRDPIDAELIAGLPPRIRALATFSVGTDHIDLAAAKARALPVGNTPGVLTDATAEIALLLMLGAARRALEGILELRHTSWTGWRPTHLMGTQLSGKRLGIVGMGRIGAAVADRARAFGMDIHYHNRKPVDDATAHGATYHAELDDLLAVSDFLSLHCPSTPATHKLINAERLAKLPAGAILINTARGDVVDDAALVAALRDGTLAAAGLDVFDGEPDIHQPYRELTNVFALPHLGSATTETRIAMGDRALDNLEAVMRGEEMPFRVV